MSESTDDDTVTDVAELSEDDNMSIVTLERFTPLKHFSSPSLSVSQLTEGSFQEQRSLSVYKGPKVTHTIRKIL